MKNWSGTVSLKSRYAGLYEYTHVKAYTFDQAIDTVLDQYRLRGKEKNILEIKLTPTTSKGAMDNTGRDLGETQIYKHQD